jgi:UDP-N-acetyl-D-mannosaminuronate dehydrogenase
MKSTGIKSEHSVAIIGLGYVGLPLALLTSMKGYLTVGYDIDTYLLEELRNNKIKYYTIHDAWLIDKSDVKQVEGIINRLFEEKINRKPKLSIDKIN